VADAWTTVLHDVRTLTVELAEAGFGVARRITRPPSLPTLPRPTLPRPTFPRSALRRPGIAQLLDSWARLEDALLREVRARLDRLEAAQPHPYAERSAQWRSPARLMSDLLASSAGGDGAAARDELHRALLLRLVPDEAKVLATLATGPGYPLVHVQTRSRTVLANASTVGTAAGVALPEAVFAYVANLLALGLAEEGPEDESLHGEYEALLARPELRAAAEMAREDGRLGARVTRRTLRVSALGRELWAACLPTEPLPAELVTAELVTAEFGAVELVPAQPVEAAEPVEPVSG
jgi:hypothetical protein